MKRTQTYLTAVITMLTTAVMVTQAAITTNYYDPLVGDSVTYTDIKEATIYGEYGEPTIVGDAIHFDPFNMAAAANHSVWTDAPTLNDAELQFDVVAMDGKYIEDITFEEGGDYSMTGLTNAGVQVKAYFYLTIFEIDHGEFYLNEPIRKEITYDSGQIGHAGGLFGTSDNWGGSVVFDMEQILADNFISGYTNGVTSAHITLDNVLMAGAYPGAEALIKKKHLDGLTITTDVVPEPASAVLLIGTATLLTAIRRRFIG